MRVLIVEDDEEMARMAVDVAFDGLSGLERALCNDYDVIVLDRDLPGMHGDTVCADDYLPKPFDFSALVARIGAPARRAHPAAPRVVRHGDLVVDTARRRASRGDRRLELVPKEFGVLELLLASGGRAVSAEELLERVWDEAADPFTHAVKITISRLRSKLGDPPVIETGLGLGLSIVQAIATAHDADLTATAEPGGGLTVTVGFPPPVTGR
ncbi:response regulator transcription factor [Streptacidiphilus sp. PAMC 29251]